MGHWSFVAICHHWIRGFTRERWKP